MQAHPRLFEIMQDEPERSFGYPLCPEGWHDMLERRGRIEKALRDNETFEFVRIKQKFGILRVGWEGAVSEETRARIEEALALAEARSSCTCEFCGTKGDKYHASENVMLGCARHAEGRQIMATRANECLHSCVWWRRRSRPFARCADTTARPTASLARRRMSTPHCRVAAPS